MTGGDDCCLGDPGIVLRGVSADVLGLGEREVSLGPFFRLSLGCSTALRTRAKHSRNFKIAYRTLTQSSLKNLFLSERKLEFNI